MLRRRFLSISLAASAASLLITSGAIAQDQAADWPEQPVTILVPYAAGGTSDMFARLLAEGLSEAFGQQFLVENKPGASGNIGTAELARAEPDGYTLGMGTVATHAINPLVFKDLPFDAEKDFAPVSLVATLPNVLVVNPEVEAESVPELIELLKAKPGELTFASSGVLPTGFAPIDCSCSCTSGCCMIRCTSSLTFWTISGGVPAGANMACHDVASKSGMNSAMGGTSGSSSELSRLVTASGRTAPALACCAAVGMLSKTMSTCPPTTSMIDCPLPL